MAARRIISLLLASAGLAIGAAGSATQDAPPASEQTGEQINQQIARLIEQLGHEDYYVRQRAQDELAKFSFEAFDALQAATNHKDLEIAARARYLLRLMRVEFSAKDDPPEVVALLKDYELQDASTKRVRMGRLAELADGRGVPALCRLVRYEKSPVLSKAAAIELLGLQPDAEPPTEELAGKLRKHLGGSRRTAAAWLFTWLRFRDDPEAALGEWAKLVEVEHSLLRRPPTQTTPDLIATLVRFQIRWLKRLEHHQQAVAAMRRLVEIQQGDPKTLAELLDWLIQQKAWEVADELAAKFAGQFADNPILLYTLAQAQAEQGDLTRAEQTAQRALKLNPENNSTQLAKHYSTARTLRARGLLDWARGECFHVIGTGDPDNAVVAATLMQLLNWLVADEAWKEVDELAAKFASRFAHNAVLQYTLAQAHAEQGRRQQAEQTAAKALKLNPGKDDDRLSKHRTVAEVLRYRRLFKWAEQEYRHLIALGDEKPEPAILAGLADCLIQQKAWKAVDELAEQFRLRFAGNPILLYARAQAQAEQGNHQQAEQSAEKALKLNPGKDAELLSEHHLAARVLADRGLFEWARREYRHVIDSGAVEVISVIAAQSGLSEMSHDQGEDLEAAQVGQAMLKNFEAHPDVEEEIGLESAAIRARMNYFFACHYKGKNDSAKHREYLDKALQADPSDLDVLIACYRLPGQTPEYREKIRRLVKKTAEDLRQEITEHPTSSMPYNQFAWLVGNTEGDLDEALRCSKRSLQIRPYSGGYCDTLAHVYFARGEYEMAVNTQTKAAELEPYSGLIARQLEVFRRKWEEE